MFCCILEDCTIKRKLWSNCFVTKLIIISEDFCIFWYAQTKNTLIPILVFVKRHNLFLPKRTLDLQHVNCLCWTNAACVWELLDFWHRVDIAGFKHRGGCFEQQRFFLNLHPKKWINMELVPTFMGL